MTPIEIQQSIEAVIKGLTPLAQQVQVPIEKLFELAIKQNYVYLTQDIIFLSIYAILVISTIGAWAWIFYLISKENYGEFYDAVCVVATVMLALSILATIPAIITTQDATARYINPEYMALQDIANMIK